jgi:hypothetical protein
MPAGGSRTPNHPFALTEPSRLAPLLVARVRSQLHPEDITVSANRVTVDETGALVKDRGRAGMPVDEQGDPFGLIESMFPDLFRDSLDGKQPPAGYRLWGYKLVRSDRRAGGELRWPDEDGVLVETGLSDGYHGGVTDPGTVAITPEIADVALTSAVGGSVLLTVAYNPEDVTETRDQWLHTFPFGAEFLNLAETLIEYDIDYDDLAADSLAFVQRLLPRPHGHASQGMPPTLTPGPRYRTYGGLGDDDGVQQWPELTAVYLPAAGEPRMVRLEANGPCSSRERQRLLGGPVTHVQLDTETRMLLQAGAPGAAPVNGVATALLSRYPEVPSAEPVRGGALLIGTRGDGRETDAFEEAIQRLADLGYPVVPQRDSP